jgi:hypothetical protein
MDELGREPHHLFVDFSWRIDASGLFDVSERDRLCSWR